LELAAVKPAEFIGITWIHGWLTLGVYRGKECIQKRSCNEPALTYQDLEQALQKVWDELACECKTVEVIIQSSQMVHVAVPHPKMKEKDLQVFLARKARAEWKQEASFQMAYTTMFRYKKQEQSLLHIASQNWMEIFVRFCKNNKLHVNHIFTPHTLCSRMLPACEGTIQTGLTVVVYGNHTYIAVGHSGAPPIFVRELTFTWEREGAFEPEWMIREINRSILFTKQQYGLSVQNITLHGHLSAQGKQAVFEYSPELQVSAVESYDWHCIDTQGLDKWHYSLVPDSIKIVKKRRRYSEIVFMGSLLFISLATISNSYVQFLVLQLHQKINELQLDTKVQELKNEKNILSNQLQQITAFRQVIQYKNTRIQEPVALWFAGFASDALPNQLAWTDVRVYQDSTSSAWLVHIEGISPRDPLLAAKLLQQYQQRLTNGLLAMKIKVDWQVKWLDNLRYGSSLETNIDVKPFYLEGRFP
jgi:FtsZ-binding cell division protein ZapB